MIELRKWQKRALAAFELHQELCFLLDVAPGGGKTDFSACSFQHLLERNKADRALIIVPTTALKSSFRAKWKRHGIDLTTDLQERAYGRKWPSQYKGGVITYQQLPNLLGAIRWWHDHGERIFSIFDEVHHTSDQNDWGDAAERLAEYSVKILAMTGTPFRSDGRRISFISYDASDQAVADFKYSYSAAVADLVCRPLIFITADGSADFIKDEKEKRVRVSGAKTEDDARSVGKTIFKSDSDWLEPFIKDADDRLSAYRAIAPDAGGLMICRAGIDEKHDEKYLKQVGKLVHKLTGETPTIISYDDNEANAKIERFTASSKRWILSVRKVSEGVDIPRLRLIAVATRITTELRFRQSVLRAGRVQNPDPNKIEYATVCLAKFAQLEEWAATLSDQAKTGLRTLDLLDGERPTALGNGSSFIALGSEYEAGGAISDFGDRYTADEIKAAEQLQRGDPQLIGIQVTALAHLLRKAGVAPSPIQPEETPLEVQKKELSKKLNTVVRALAERRNPEDPNYAKAWHDLFAKLDVVNLIDLMNNYDITKMHEADRIARDLLMDAENA